MNIASRVGSAKTGEDYEAITLRRLTIAAGRRETSEVSIVIVDNAFDENYETFVIALSAPRNARLASLSWRTMTISDRDDLPTAKLELVTVLSKL